MNHSVTEPGLAPSVRSLIASASTKISALHATSQLKKGFHFPLLFISRRKSVDADLLGDSYLARLEHRIQDIEASLRKLEHNQGNGPPEPVSSSHSENCIPSIPSGQGVTLPTPLKPGLPVHSNPVAQERAEYGEIDVSENPIDGMAAINFTDEEDCGFFGMNSRRSTHPCARA